MGGPEKGAPRPPQGVVARRLLSKLDGVRLGLPSVRELDGHAFRASDLPPGRVAVMFTADWCGYCQRFLPTLRGCEPLFLVDVSQEDEPAWDDLAFEVVPTVIVFADGQEVGRWSGILRQSHADEIRAALASA